MDYTLDFSAVILSWPLLAFGVWKTFVLTLWSGSVGLLAGFALAVARNASMRPVRYAAKWFIEGVRNTPLLAQIFFVFFGLPSLGIRLSPDTAAILALGLNGAAYFAEIIRAGMQSVPKGQSEAAYALGLDRPKTFFLVVLKPAINAVYPALSGQMVLLFLGTSVVSSISAVELTSTAQEIQASTFRTFKAYFVILVIYLVISMLLSWCFRRVGYRVFAYSVKGR